MQIINIFETTKPNCSPLYRIFLYLSIAFFISASPAGAITEGNVAFSWQANPVEDHVIGYRLYYGTKSRFDSSGNPKTNFSYDYYIDFAELERCDGSSDGTSCEMLSSKELQCDNLYIDFPKCTVAQLYGLLYFSLTAYNAQDESGFTPELKMSINSEFNLAALPGISLLLLKK